MKGQQKNKSKWDEMWDDYHKMTREDYFKKYPKDEKRIQLTKAEAEKLREKNAKARKCQQLFPRKDNEK